MENAVDALKLSAAVLIFVISLSLTMKIFTETRQTADIILQRSDPAEFLELSTYSDYLSDEGERVVGLETIIPNLYKYYKEGYTILFMNSGNSSYLKMYTSDKYLWTHNDISEYENKYKLNSDGTEICYFDSAEELKRHEPWTAGLEENKKFIDTFINGGRYNYPSGSGWYTFDSFIDNYKNRKFIENIGEYEYNISSDTETYGSNTLLQNKKKRVIIYTLI